MDHIKLENSEGRYRQLVELSPDAIFITIEGTIIYINPAGINLFGATSHEELVGKNIMDLIHPDFKEIVAERIRHLRDEKTPVPPLEEKYLRLDGSVIDVEVAAAPFQVQGRVAAQVIVRNITKRKRAENIMQARLRLLEFADSHSMDELISASLDEIETLTGSNIGFYHFLHSDQKTLSLQNWSTNTLKNMCTAERKGTSYNISQAGVWVDCVHERRPVIHNDYASLPHRKGMPKGHAAVVREAVVPIFRGNLIKAIIGIGNKPTIYNNSDLEIVSQLGDLSWDIVERKRAEEQIKNAAQKWRTTFDAISDAVFLMDRQCRIIQCNQALVDFVGKPIEEIIGRTCWELIHGTSGPIENCPVMRLWESRRPETLTLPQGDRWLYAKVDPIFDEVGEVTGAVHTISDITDYYQAMQKIQNLNTLLQAIKNINEAFLRIKSEKELFQHTCDQLIGIPYVRFVWVGLVEPENFEIKPVAWAGHEESYLSSIKVTWDDSSYGEGPGGSSIKTSEPAIINDIESDRHFLPWRDEALKSGYASIIALPLLYDKEPLGVIGVYSGIKHAFKKEELEFLKQVASDIAVGIKSLRLEQEVIENLIRVQITMRQTVEAIATMAELRDPYTAGHQRNVTQLACMLAQEMNLSENTVECIRVAGFLHDIGKIAVPAEILSKPGKLSDYEMNMLRCHPQAGYDILKKIDFPWPVAQIILQHHERINGSGYPQGLKGPDILQEAKILAVADVIEAMAAHRPYRPALGIDKALQEITMNKGILYDPEVVDACVKLFTEQGFGFEAK